MANPATSTNAPPQAPAVAAPPSARTVALLGELAVLKAEIAQCMGGAPGQSLANAIEAYVGAAIEQMAITALPGILKPFLGGPIKSMGDALIADAEKATDSELQSIADKNPIPKKKA